MYMKYSKGIVVRKRQEVSIPHTVQRRFMSSKCGCVSYDRGPWALFSSLSNRMIMSLESFVSVRYIIMWKVLKSEHSKNEQGE